MWTGSPQWPWESSSKSVLAFSRDVTRTKLIKNGRHFGVQHRFLEKLACLSMEPRSYIEALGAELVGKEGDQLSCVKFTLAKLKPSGKIRPKFKSRIQNYRRVLCLSNVDRKLPRLIHYGAG